MANPKKFVKLGESANSFYDASTGLKLTVNQSKELSTAQAASKRVKSALKHGHLEYAEEGEFDNVEDIDVDAEDVDAEYTEEILKGKNKAALVAILETIQKAEEEEDRLTEAEMTKMSKQELIDAILESYEAE
jgi:hypothetical protein